MAEAQTAFVKYVFLDVVGFTQGRSVEAQADIVAQLNQIILDALRAHDIKDDRRILIPTGDGMCIALIEITKPFDIHLLLALNILAQIQEFNNQNKGKMRQFWVRIGLNENVDNLITDVNGKLNVAGMGISMAQRVMSLADAGQILVNQTVHETLRAREKYMSAFREYYTSTKHGESLVIHQYIAENIIGLYTTVPSVFKSEPSVPKKLSEFCAHYITHALRHQDFFLSVKSDFLLEYAGVITLYFLATDTLAKSKMGKFDEFRPSAWKAGEVKIDEQYEHYKGLDYWIIKTLADNLRSNYLADSSPCFEGYAKIFVSSEGVKKLEEDWPEIAKQFKIQ